MGEDSGGLERTHGSSLVSTPTRSPLARAGNPCQNHPGEARHLPLQAAAKPVLLRRNSRKIPCQCQSALLGCRSKQRPCRITLPALEPPNVLIGLNLCNATTFMICASVVVTAFTGYRGAFCLRLQRALLQVLRMPQPHERWRLRSEARSEAAPIPLPQHAVEAETCQDRTGQRIAPTERLAAGTPARRLGPPAAATLG